MTFLSLGLSITRGHLPWVGCERVPRVGVQDHGGVEASVRFSCWSCPLVAAIFFEE